MAYKKKNGELDMRYNSSKEKAKKARIWGIIGTILAVIFLMIFGGE